MQMVQGNWLAISPSCYPAEVLASIFKSQHHVHLARHLDATPSTLAGHSLSSQKPGSQSALSEGTSVDLCENQTTSAS